MKWHVGIDLHLNTTARLELCVTSTGMMDMDLQGD